MILDVLLDLGTNVKVIAEQALSFLANCFKPACSNLRHTQPKFRDCVPSVLVLHIYLFSDRRIASTINQKKLIGRTMKIAENVVKSRNRDERGQSSVLQAFRLLELVIRSAKDTNYALGKDLLGLLDRTYTFFSAENIHSEIEKILDVMSSYIMFSYDTIRPMRLAVSRIEESHSRRIPIGRNLKDMDKWTELKNKLAQSEAMLELYKSTRRQTMYELCDNVSLSD